MGFKRYFGSLARKSGRYTPHIDEAKRDYLASIRQSLDGMLAVQ